MTQNRVKLYYVATVKAVFSFCDGKKKENERSGYFEWQQIEGSLKFDLETPTNKTKALYGSQTVI